MTPPRHVKDRYLRGGCLAFAVAASRELGLPIHVLVDTTERGDEWMHAFVVDTDRQVAIDIRGEMPLEPAAIGEGSSFDGTLSILPTTAEEAGIRMGLAPTRREVWEAVRAFRDNVDPGLGRADLAPR